MTKEEVMQTLEQVIEQRTEAGVVASATKIVARLRKEIRRG